MKRVNVLIVGAGTVGCALAIELAGFGIHAMIVDETDGQLTFPQFNQFSWRTTEYLRRWGLADRLRFEEFPKNRPLTCAYTTGVDGFEITRFEHPSNEDSKGKQNFSPESILWSPTFYSLPVLRERATQCESVELLYRQRFVSFQQLDESVQVNLVDTVTGEQQVVVCDYVVGCDGGKSAVRKEAGLQLEGRFSTDRQLAIYFRAEIPHYWEKGFGIHTWILKPEVKALLVSMNGADEWRCGPVGLAEEEVNSKTPEAWLKLILGDAVPIEVFASRPWGGHYAVADHYRNGRIFIAGDAAHLLWPAGGFGMNTGVGDAVNLAWKLAAALQGWGGPKLLDSYESERRPEAIQRVEGSSETRSADGFQVSPMLGQPTPEGAAIRQKAAMGIRSSMRGKQWMTNMPGIDLGHVYEGSPVCIPDGTPPRPWQPDSYTQSSRPGSRAPHVWLSEGRSSLDLFGSAFTLLDFGDSADQTLESARHRIPFRYVHFPNAGTENVYPARFTLVRPDGYVAWRGDTCDQRTLQTLLSAATGHPLEIESPE